MSRDILDAVLRVIEGDPHVFGKRPCVSCLTVSNLVGQDFGCEKKRAVAGIPRVS